MPGSDAARVLAYLDSGFRRNDGEGAGRTERECFLWPRRSSGLRRSFRPPTFLWPPTFLPASDVPSGLRRSFRPPTFLWPPTFLPASDVPSGLRRSFRPPTFLPASDVPLASDVPSGLRRSFRPPTFLPASDVPSGLRRSFRPPTFLWPPTFLPASDVPSGLRRSFRPPTFRSRPVIPAPPSRHSGESRNPAGASAGAVGGDASQPYRISRYRSRQTGFSSSINSSFQARFHSFSRLSRTMALSIVSWRSNQTSRCVR